MRARSALQRFPVAQWVEDLDILQSEAIRKHWKYTGQGNRSSLLGTSDRTSAATTAMNTPNFTPTPSRAPSPTREITTLSRKLSSRVGPGHRQKSKLHNHSATSRGTSPSAASTGHLEEIDEVGYTEDDYPSDATGTPGRGRSRSRSRSRSRATSALILPSFDRDFLLTPSTGQGAVSGEREALQPSAYPGDGSQPPIPETPPYPGTPDRRAFFVNSTPRPRAAQRGSTLSLADVVGDKRDYSLQKVSPFFTDPNKEYIKAFEKRLEGLNGRTSEEALCIEEYLVKSEKNWFGRFHDAKMGKSPNSTPAPSIFRSKRSSTAASVAQEDVESSSRDDSLYDQFLLEKDYKPPTGVKKILMTKIGDWPLYSFFLAFVSVVHQARSDLGTKANAQLGSNNCRQLLPNHSDQW